MPTVSASIIEYVSCSGEETQVTVSGLAENMEEAMQLAEKVIAHAKANPEALQMLKFNTLYERRNAKLNQRSNAQQMSAYAMYGPKNPQTNVPALRRDGSQAGSSPCCVCCTWP